MVLLRDLLGGGRGQSSPSACQQLQQPLWFSAAVIHLLGYTDHTSTYSPLMQSSL
jgi:hypothetical protein